jgi:hypothetical protein
MFYGRGAGRYPTAGAVLADICAVLSGAAEAEKNHTFEKANGDVLPFGEVPFTYYIRVASGNDCAETLSRVFDKVEMLEGSPAGTSEFICSKLGLDELNALKADLGDVLSVIRVLE